MTPINAGRSDPGEATTRAADRLQERRGGMHEADDAILECIRSKLFAGVPAERIDTVTTHISIVLLGGETAVKLKRPVKRPYVDFSTPALRLAACERELDLNRRTAPQLYRAVRRITREPGGGLVLDGGGELVDAVVVMRRFDGDGLFDRRAMEGTLTGPLMDRLARTIAAFHETIPPDPAPDGATRMAAVLDINEAAFAATELFGGSDRFWTSARRPAGCGGATATCICATSAPSTTNRCCSTAWNSTRHWEPPTPSTIWRSS